MSLCHRCGSPLPVEHDSSLFYCIECGAVQVLLSEELREKAEALTDDSTEAAAARAPRVDPLEISWRGAIQCAGLAAIVAALLTLLSLIAPPIFLLAWLWIVAAPVFVPLYYHSRFPLSRMTPAAGARMGVLTGTFVLTVIGIMNTSALALSRHLHALGEFDGRLTAMVQQANAQAQANSGVTDNTFLQQLAQPEFRVGLMLGGVAMLSCILLGMSAIGGAIGGFMRSKSAARP